jgi:hypothetical protein
MTSDMQTHTRRLAIRLALVITLFAVLSTSLATLLRYREALNTLLAHHQVIQRNLAQMRMATNEIRDTIAGFKRLLPNGFDRASSEMLLFTRLDEIKTRLPPGEMTVKTLETREGQLSLEFSYKPATLSYTSLLNTLGQLELLILPYVSIRKVMVENPVAEKPGPLAITVDGILMTPAPVTDGEAAVTSPDPVPVPATGRVH